MIVKESTGTALFETTIASATRSTAFPDFFDFNERIRKPGGFRLDVAASFRRWNTVSGKATFLSRPESAKIRRWQRNKRSS